MSRRLQEKPIKLVEVAKRHFLKHGIANANLRSIAQEAGLTTGAVYHHFAGKDELLVEVCLEGYQVLLNRLEAAATLTRGQPARERLLAYFDAYLGFFVENTGYFELIERFERDSASLRISSELRQQTRVATEMAMDHIRNAIGKATPGCAAKAELIAILGQGFIQHLRTHRFEHSGVTPGEVRKLCGAVVERLLDGD